MNTSLGYENHALFRASNAFNRDVLIKHCGVFKLELGGPGPLALLALTL